MVLPAEGRVETRVTDDGRRRPAARVLMAAIVTWLVATVVILVQIAVVVLPDPSSHEAGDTLVFGMIVFVPQFVIALVGLAALGSLRRRGTRAPSLGILWGVLETAFGLFASSRLLTLALAVVTEGRGVYWSAADSSLVFTYQSGAEYTYIGDLVSVGLFVVALIGLAAAIVLRMTRPARAA